MKFITQHLKPPLIFILILTGLTVCAQDALLWKISDKDGSPSSYLYGTIHLKDKRVFIFTDTALSCMKKCDKLALELDLNPMNMLQYSDLLFLKGDSSLKDIFNEVDYKIISERIEKITGLSFAHFDRLKPVALLSVVMQTMLEGDMESALDEYIYEKAHQVKMDIIGLETFDEQFRLLESIPMGYVIDFLKNPDKGMSEIEMHICYYQAARIDDLLRLMQEDETMVSLRNDFLDKRNIKMAGKLDHLIQENTVFVAVGAGHLPGENGLINLLKEKGYTVSPVMLETPEGLECD